jgi:ABC-2 type transport system permease protein
MNLNRIQGVLYKQWLTNKRDIFRIFDVFWWPAFQLFVWGLFSVYLNSTANAGKVNLVTLLLGAVILWTFFDRSSRDISIAFIDELWNRNFINLFSSPLKVSEYLVGVVIVAFVKLIISAVFMFFLSAVFYNVDIFKFGWSFIPLATGLVIMGWSISIIVQSCILKFGHTVEVFIWAAAVLVQPFSCVFYPLSSLPTWAQKIALCLPSTYLFENFRLNLMSQKIDLTGLFISYGINIVYFMISLWIFYRSYDDAKNRGFLTREY